MMLKEEKYFASHRPYLLDPKSFRVDSSKVMYGDGWHGTWFHRGIVDALWFRKKQGVLVATLGTISDPTDSGLVSFEDFVDGFKYGRYGGNVAATWDGESLWTPIAHPDFVRGRMINVLKPALKSFPEIPAGWDGWYDIREKY